MAKSMRSKWKKKMKAERTRREEPRKLERLAGLHTKLGLAAKGKLNRLPTQEPRKEFHFSHPDVDPSKRLTLQRFSSNVHKGLRGHEGNATGPAPSKHPQARNPRSPKLQPQQAPANDDDDVFAPAGGHASKDQTGKNVEEKYQAAASKMASAFVPSLDMVMSRKARQKAARAAATGSRPEQDSDNDDNDGAAAEEEAPQGVRLATAADKRRSGSSKMSKGSTGKKGAATKRR